MHESQEVISGPKFPLSKGTIEPIVLDVEAEEMPSEIVRRAQDPKPSLSRSEIVGVKVHGDAIYNNMRSDQLLTSD